MTKNSKDNLRPSKPTLGYPSRTKAVEALWDQGFDYRQIAERTGISDGAAAALLTAVRKRRGKVVYFFAKDDRNPFRAAALRRGVTQEQVVQNLLDTIAAEPDLIDNILDDDGGEP
jgi:hypothetical protein